MIEADTSPMSVDSEKEESPESITEVMKLESYCRKIQAPPHLHGPIYSRVVQYLSVDFLNCSLPMIIAATADF